MNTILDKPALRPPSQPRQLNRFFLIGILVITAVIGLIATFSFTRSLTAASPNRLGLEALSGEGGIHGMKWHDLDGDGVRDPEEPRIKGWIIWLEGEGMVLSTTTNADGFYWFMDIPTGTYTIEEEMLPGWTQTFPPSGSYHVTYVPSQPIDGLNFGNHAQQADPGSIHGMKWHDHNGNGHRDPGEPGLAGWHIVIEGANYLSETVTGTDGMYWFMNLPPGEYHVEEIQQDGWHQTYPPEGVHGIHLEPGHEVHEVDFGNWQPEPGELHGMKWHDLNGNGEKDGGEPGLEGWVIKLVLDDHGVISETVTDASGNYWFMDILPGDYFLVEVLQDGWQQTYPHDGFHYVELGSGQVIDGLNFGNWQPEPGSIHGMKWYDENGDGFKDPTEQGIPGWGISIEGEGYFEEMLTDSNGEYWFMDLMPGTYIIEEAHETGWQQTYPPEHVHEIHLEAGQTITDVNFGNWNPPLGSLHGTKFHDLNGNGVQDANEPGLPGWTILLQDEDGQVISTETDSDGNYWFMDILPGNFHITELFEPGSGWTMTAPAGTHEVELAPGQEIHDLDLGNWQQGKDDFCIIPWDNHFLNDDYLDTQVYIFNASDMPEKGYVVHMIGLPAGTVFPGDEDGSTTFDIQSSLPIVLDPGEYGTVNVRVYYPPAFDDSTENRAVMQAVVTNLATGESFGCQAALWPMVDWWTMPVVNMGIGDIPFGFTLATGFTVTNNIPHQPPNGLLAPLGHEGETVTYTIWAMTPGHDTDPVVSLNGLPPGEAVVGQVTLDHGESLFIPVTVQFTEHVTDSVTDILFELDIDGDGEADAVTSSLVRSVDNKLYLPAIFR